MQNRQLLLEVNESHSSAKEVTGLPQILQLQVNQLQTPMTNTYKEKCGECTLSHFLAALLMKEMKG